MRALFTRELRSSGGCVKVSSLRLAALLLVVLVISFLVGYVAMMRFIP